jgi:uncharacterized membrane protein
VVSQHKDLTRAGDQGRKELVRQNIYHYFLFALSLLGILVAGYVLLTRLGKAPLVCVTGSDCGAVNASRYAYIFGVPVSGYGTVFYLAMLSLSIGAARNSRLISWLFGLSILGLFFVGYMTYAQKYLIGIFCFWCLTSAVIATLLFAMATLLFLRERKII